MLERVSQSSEGSEGRICDESTDERREHTVCVLVMLEKQVKVGIEEERLVIFWSTFSGFCGFSRHITSYVKHDKEMQGFLPHLLKIMIVETKYDSKATSFYPVVIQQLYLKIKIAD